MPRVTSISTPCLCGHPLSMHTGGAFQPPCMVASCPCESFAAPASETVRKEAAQRRVEVASDHEVLVHDSSVNGARSGQVGGDHYRQHQIQPWDIWQEYGLNAFEGAVLKYLLRRKGDRLEDLKKARHTLDRLIEIEEQHGGE